MKKEGWVSVELGLCRHQFGGACGEERRMGQVSFYAMQLSGCCIVLTVLLLGGTQGQVQGL